MRIWKSSIPLLVLCLSLDTYAAAKKSKEANSTAPPSYELPQPAAETLDYGMYQRIRDEGLGHSHVMEYASALVDGIGSDPALKDYHLLPSVRGDLLIKLGRHAEARPEFERAAKLTRNSRERALILERAAECRRRETSTAR